MFNAGRPWMEICLPVTARDVCRCAGHARDFDTLKADAQDPGATDSYGLISDCR